MIAPTLLVGLGGTGSKIVCRVSKMVTEEQKKHIGFAVFDTDINELREIREANPYIKTIQTSTKLTVGEYLNIDTHARDTWFPVNGILNSKSLTEGAGQVRAISRLALDTAIRAGNMEPLHKAVEELYKLEGDSGEQGTSSSYCKLFGRRYRIWSDPSCSFISEKLSGNKIPGKCKYYTRILYSSGSIL